MLSQWLLIRSGVTRFGNYFRHDTMIQVVPDANP